MPFAVVHVAFFVAWILVNTGKLPALAPFVPFPFNFLTQYNTGLLLGSSPSSHPATRQKSRTLKKT